MTFLLLDNTVSVDALRDMKDHKQLIVAPHIFSVPAQNFSRFLCMMLGLEHGVTWDYVVDLQFHAKMFCVTIGDASADERRLNILNLVQMHLLVVLMQYSTFRVDSNKILNSDPYFRSGWFVEFMSRPTGSLCR